MVKFRSDKVFIIQTRSGGVFLVGTLTMLILGAGYSNNLINLLGFFMLSLLFVGMTLTHFQIKGLEIEGVDLEPCFADQEMIGHALIKNPTAEPRFGIVPELEHLKAIKNGSEPSVIRGRASTRVAFSHPAQKRGKYFTKRLEINCVYPVGLFYTWKYAQVDLEYFVYPKPVSILPLPLQFKSGEADGAKRAELSGGDDFKGHRLFNAGDSARHIDWKAYARGRPMLVKELNEGDPPDLILSWDLLSHLKTEEKISQLTAWILEAFRTGLGFSLDLPGIGFQTGRGAAHTQKCLEWVAVYGLE